MTRPPQVAQPTTGRWSLTAEKQSRQRVGSQPAAGQSHAAPRTPDESPCRFLSTGVVQRSLNT